MAKRTTEMDDDGRVVTYKNTRHRRRSEERLIPWTDGPRTRGQKIARALWG
ncbi:hypothetical protein [Actinoplanes regularis]|uniref:hypothetical protein n=1 Tax=Actinoplanes regularis TaxID=52697 RepID=UPI0024A2AEF9|nr:hypothetical protein [Actinoplanes regularis]GLW32292.1 hypothetical protein Areg01_52310 [Actinoplanes regularis]